MQKRIAIVVSHPIQHFCPQYVSFARQNGITLKVFFASSLGYKKYIDLNFNQEISWNNLQLDKFDHVFLNSGAVIHPDKNIDAPELGDMLSDYDPHLVIIYGYFQKLQRRAHRWAVRNRKLLAYISDSELRHVGSKVKEFIKHFFIKRYFSKIQYFLSVGDANEDFYKYYGVTNEQIIRMHFPIDIDLYRESFQKKEVLRQKIRKKYQLSENDVCASVVGKLVPWKNQGHLIEALQRLEESGIYMHLFILGSGEMKEALQKKATVLKQSKIHFTGFVDIDQLPSYYAASDVYIHPASIEPHSIAISEAIYMGCPIIVSNTSGSYGPDDDVQPDKNGYVFEFGDIRQLAEAIKRLFLDKAKRDNFSVHSHTIAERFQKQSHGHVMTELLNRITDERN